MTSSGFTLKNFYIFLIELGFSVLFLIIFAAFHYGLVNTTKLGKKLEQSKVFNFWYFFIFGFILALITFAVSQISSIALGDIGMPLTIIGLIYAMTVFYNRSVQIGALVPSILWVLYQYHGFTSYSPEWLIRLVVMLVIAVVAIATTFVKWKQWPTFLISCGVTFASLLIIILSSINKDTTYYAITAVIAILATIFYYAVIRSINKWLSHMSTMARQGAYMDKHYLIPSVLGQYFNEFVKRYNVSQALIISLIINVPDKQKTIVLDRIYETFKDDKVLFFKSNFGTYGLILTGKEYQITNLHNAYLGNKLGSRTNHDNLALLETKLLSLNNQDVQIKAYVSVYGVHSCDLEELLQNNNFLYKNDTLSEQHNIVQLFNTNIMTQQIIDNISFATLEQKIDLKDIDVELELLKFNKDKHIYVCPRYYWPKMLTCDSQTIMQQFEPSVANTLLRSLAVKSLEKYANNDEYKKYPLLIYYPINQLNSGSWSVTNLIKKIRLFGVDPHNVILSFNVSQLNYWPKQIVENLIGLQEHDVRYLIVDAISLSSLKRLNPYGIIFDKSIASSAQTKEFIAKHKLNVL